MKKNGVSIITPAKDVLNSRPDDAELPKEALKLLPAKQTPEAIGSACTISPDDCKTSEMKYWRQKGWNVIRELSSEGRWETILSCADAPEGTEAYQQKKTLMEYQIQYLMYVTEQCRLQGHMSFTYDGEIFPEVSKMMKESGWHEASLRDATNEIGLRYTFTACSHSEETEKGLEHPYGGYDW